MTTIDTLRERSAQVSRVIVGDGYIRPSFAKADLGTIVATMHCLIGDRLNDANLIIEYLLQRDCPFDRATLSFLFDIFEGREGRHALWQRSTDGAYHLLSPSRD